MCGTLGMAEVINLPPISFSTKEPHHYGGALSFVAHGRHFARWGALLPYFNPNPSCLAAVNADRLGVFPVKVATPVKEARYFLAHKTLFQ